MVTWINNIRLFITKLANDLLNLTNRVDALLLDDIGGMNLLEGSSRGATYNTFATGYIYLGGIYLINSETFVKPGDKITASVNIISASHKVTIVLTSHDINNGYTGMAGENTSNGFGIIRRFATVPSNSVRIDMHLYSTPGAEIIYMDTKLEKGSFATDWTPHYGDIKPSLNRRMFSQLVPVGGASPIGGETYDIISNSPMTTFDIGVGYIGAKFTIINSKTTPVSFHNSTVTPKRFMSTGALIAVSNIPAKSSKTFILSRDDNDEIYALEVASSSLV